MKLDKRIPQALPRKGVAADPNATIGMVNAEEINAAAVQRRHKRLDVRRELRDCRKSSSAAAAIDGLNHENEIYGITKGQFSLVQLLEAVVEISGPCHFTLSTWTAARFEIQRMARLMESGSLLSTRWLLDFTFARRDPSAAEQIRSTFGLESVRVSQVHAKLALFGNDDWKIVLRTSMNLNMNPRMEDFTISHDAEQFAFWSTILDDIWKRQPTELQKERLGKIRKFWKDEM